MRFLGAIVLIVGLAIPTQAQRERGWSFSGRLSGSGNSDAVVTKAEPSLGYNFNEHFTTYVGVPFYFVNVSTPTAVSGTGFKSGVGNAFLGFRAGVDSEVVNYTSNLEFTAPTGDKERGFSTGRMTVDWTNRFSRTFSKVTPFGSVGIANTVSDTAFFVRPFSSLGMVGHFEGGATYDFSRAVWLGASGYAVRGSGQQRIFSRVLDRPVSTSTTTSRSSSGDRRSDRSTTDRVFETQRETVSVAEIVNDHGFSTWFGVSPKPPVDFYVGYSRSVNYDLNSVFFGVGFHVGH
jgi:hypothetical protein